MLSALLCRKGAVRDEILLMPKREPVLAADEAETVSKFQEKSLQAGDQPIFEFALLDRAAEAKEFEVIGALKHLICLLGKMFRQGERKVM